MVGVSVRPPAHGGAYDDIAFLGGRVYLSASNPPDPNTFPAVVSATLSGTGVLVTPVLMGNATATDLVSHTRVTLDRTRASPAMWGSSTRPPAPTPH